MEILPKSLRPKTLSEVIGQDKIVAALRKQAAARFPQAILLQGGTGCGKTTLARIIALSLQCTHQKKWGDPCGKCWEAWDEYAIHELNASQENGVEEMGKIADFSRYRPQHPSKRRVIILDEMQMATNNAQNLLLKPFEDPPKSTTWILCTTAPQKILQTLRSRCMAFELKGFDSDSLVALLKRAKTHSGSKVKVIPLARALQEAGVRSPRMALMAFEKYASGMGPNEAVGGVETEKVDTFRLCKAVTSGDWRLVAGILRDTEPENARWIRASVAGWLRAGLLRENRPERRVKLAETLSELIQAPYDETMMHNWLCAVLYRACRRLN